MTEKGSIGFSSPNKDIQDAFANLQQELSAKKANWESLRIQWTTLESLLTIATNNLTKSGSINPDLGITLLIAMSAKQTSQLGIELTETHNRLGAVEKSLKDIKLALKMN
jgi:hypothetical protein